MGLTVSSPSNFFQGLDMQQILNSLVYLQWSLDMTLFAYDFGYLSLYFIYLGQILLRILGGKWVLKNISLIKQRSKATKWRNYLAEEFKGWGRREFDNKSWSCYLQKHKRTYLESIREWSWERVEGIIEDTPSISINSWENLEKNWN